MSKPDKPSLQAHLQDQFVLALDWLAPCLLWCCEGCYSSQHDAQRSSVVLAFILKIGRT
jgi:hypothetical protein